ncbi:hypothetical protein B0H12DRAFT_1101219 [Mycena haematopus]|nr:hypothetical protein B0H12DRAFT_1101219 [Mycena haematopus]
MPRATSSSPKKAGNTPSPTKGATSPGIKKRREEWNKSLPPLWVKQTNFTHAPTARTITKTNAKKKYKLNDREIGTLPHEQRTSDATGYLMQLYNERQVEGLALRKSAKLGVKISKNPPKLPAWMEHIVNPQPPPLIIAEYTCPPDAVKPDPEDITWKPSKLSGPVSVQDACRLYCIAPTDIQDLSTHSPWIDLVTVAKRALTLHGGFYAHEKLVLQRREAEEKALTESIPHAYERKSLFQFSPMSQAEWDRDCEDDWMYEVPGQPSPPTRVAVFYHIAYKCLDDYGADWEWLPMWGDF